MSSSHYGHRDGGRWSNETLDFMADMVAARSREAQPVLQRSTFLTWRRRWTRCLQFLATAPLLRLSSPPEWLGTALTGSHPTWWICWSRERDLLFCFNDQKKNTPHNTVVAEFLYHTSRAIEFHVLMQRSKHNLADNTTKIQICSVT